MGFQNLIPRFQDLEPIKRSLTASFSSNIRKTLKIGIKLKYGETPTSRSLSKTQKSGTHAKSYPRRSVLLLVPKTADGRIALNNSLCNTYGLYKGPLIKCRWQVNCRWCLTNALWTSSTSSSSTSTSHLYSSMAKRVI